jgi:hypothetical protein
MVRHEATEPWRDRGIATPEVLPYLKEYMTREDAPVVVRENCRVALDMYELGVSSFLWDTTVGRALRLLIIVRKLRPTPVRQWLRWCAIRENGK